MIGTFWNLCRACPAKPVDKLHSEYRSTYRWHEYTGPRPRQDDVVRGQPPPSSGPGPAPEPEPPRLRPPGGARRVAHEDHLRADAPDNSEPILPRRRKHPLLAYRCHEVFGLTAAASEDCLDSSDRFRSAERLSPRGRGGRRSRSEGPPGCPQSPSGSPSGSPGPHQPRPHRGAHRAGRGPRAVTALIQQTHTAHSDSEPDEGLVPDMSRSTPRKAVKMVAAGSGEGTGANLPAAGLPTERAALRSASDRYSCGQEFRRRAQQPQGQGLPPPAPQQAQQQQQAQTRMEAAVHNAVLAASRPAAGKMSGMAQTANMTAPRKSLSMGALRAREQQRSRVADQDRTDDAGESEPLMASQDHGDADDMRGEEKIREDNIGKDDKTRLRKEFKTEYKKKFRPFSQYEYVEGRFMKRREDEQAPAEQPEPAQQQQPQKPWYAEVIELRRKAGEYKHRGWGTELAPEHIAELYSKQMLLWEQVSRRSSLSALSLAAVASPRSISKEEKERENSRRTSPTKAASVSGHQASARQQRPHTAQPKLPGVHERSKSEKARKSEKLDDNKREGAPRSSRKEFPLRHHLERTTGAEDGALLLSPTREKLEPVTPRRKEEPSASPKRSPGLAQTGRSQSLGPGGAPETRSPKRIPRAPASAAPAERRPRPSKYLWFTEKIKNFVFK
ncbi:uncharacterized protein LOC113209418 isoform X2 [Frankliniella occidentalis]|uniref:Nuclear protein MDM1 n=1 Tax=Frankliniella occidentalis TaxID=133901 RepID=A0A9C6XSP7_FRAOC|nr:uncharacterized protein LOC113209418 isoform X2 [Frankliniella occidentalis]